MQKLDFAKIVTTIGKEDSRYDAKAFFFVREGLDFTLKTFKRQTGKTPPTHVSGQELLEGLRQYTLKEFGPMSKTVLNEWGIQQCEDFGQIVFHLVRHGVLGKNENDKVEDFSSLWSFEEAFVQPFLPISREKRPSLRVKKGVKQNRLKKTDKKAL
ncbi:MAG: Minf_1886 family protein [bacterium]